MKHWTALCLILAITAVLGSGICILAGDIMSESRNPEDKFTEKSVVTSFYPVYIMALNLTDGVDGISLVNLAQNHGGCLHDYQLTTENMRLLEDASLFIVNGGGMESFLEEVAENNKNLEIIYCNNGIKDAIADNEENAHYWMNPSLYIKQVEYLAKMLSLWDPAHTAEYEKNKNAYCQKISELSDRMDNELAFLSGAHIISFHEAFQYLADRLSINTDYTLDLDGEVYLGAGEISDILEKADKDDISFIWIEASTKQEFRSLVSGGGNTETIILDALINGENDKDAYINGMRRNIEALKEMK